MELRSLGKGKEELAGIGSITKHGLRSRWTFELKDGRVFEVRRPSHGPRWRVTVTGDDGTMAGSYDQQKLLTAGGPIRFGQQELHVVTAKPAVALLDLLDGDVKLARGEGHTKGTYLTIDQPERIAPPMLLFFAWLVNQYFWNGNGGTRITKTLMAST